MGIIKSGTFNAFYIQRTTIFELLAKCGCNDDEVRLSRLLLSKTMLRVNVNGTMSVEFQNFLGAFQGDCFSG